MQSARRRAKRELARLVTDAAPLAMAIPPARLAADRVLPDLVAFARSAPEDRLTRRDHSLRPRQSLPLYSELRKQLAATGVPVEDARIDLDDFERWIAEYPELRTHYQRETEPTVVAEKCLEHYLVFRLLGIVPGDVIVDAGAQRSPWAEIMNARAYRAYRLDLSYPSGLNGIDIGADAGATGLPDDFCDVLAAHCS